MSILVPYVTFQNTCREAMNFYKDALGAEITLQTVGEMYGENADIPAESRDKIMHASLNLDSEALFFASDMFTGETVFGENISFTLNCRSLEEITNFFNNLSKEAKHTKALKKEVWGDMYGEVVDKYGLRWLFNFHQVPENN